MYKKSYDKMLTKTQAKIMEIFAANIVRCFSIKGVSKIMGKDYSLVYRSIKPLIAKSLLVKDEQGYLSLNYKKNIAHKAGLTMWEMENYLVDQGFKSSYSIEDLEREMKMLEK